jgi:hypothetical protein
MHEGVSFAASQMLLKICWKTCADGPTAQLSFQPRLTFLEAEFNIVMLHNVACFLREALVRAALGSRGAHGTCASQWMRRGAGERVNGGAGGLRIAPCAALV